MEDVLLVYLKGGEKQKRTRSAFFEEVNFKPILL